MFLVVEGLDGAGVLCPQVLGEGDGFHRLCGQRWGGSPLAVGQGFSTDVGVGGQADGEEFNGPIDFGPRSVLFQGLRGG